MPACFDVFHDAADHACLAVGDAIDIDFDGILQETIHQDGPFRAGLHSVTDVTAQIILLVHDLHGAAAKNEGGAHQHRIADSFRDCDGLVLVDRRAARRLLETELVEHRREMPAILRHLDAGRLGADDRYSRLPRARQRD